MTREPLPRQFERIGRQRIDRRRLVQGAALGVGAAAVSAPRLIVPARARARQGATVTFWTASVEPDLSILGKIVEEYNATGPAAPVEMLQQPPEAVTDSTRLMTAVRGGTGPDLYYLDRFIVAQRAADGLLQDLSQFPDGANILESYLPFAAAEASYEGKPFALPFDTDARALYFNRGMLEEAGVDLEEFDPASGPMTWDRLAEIANGLNEMDSGGNFSQMGFVPWVNQGWHYTYGFSWNGSFYDEAACQVTPDDAPIVEAFTWVQDYCVELDPQKVSAFGTPSMADGFPPAQHPFTVGTLAMEITGDWVINQMATYAPDTDYGITFIPVPNEGDESATWAGGWSIAMPQGAKNPEGAWEFMRYISGEPGQRTYTRDSKHLPTWAALLEEADLYDERHRFFSEQLLPIAKNRPPLPVGALYWDELTTAWQETYLNTEEPTVALTSVKERVQAQLQQFC